MEKNKQDVLDGLDEIELWISEVVRPIDSQNGEPVYEEHIENFFGTIDKARNLIRMES